LLLQAKAGHPAFARSAKSFQLARRVWFDDG